MPEQRKRIIIDCSTNTQTEEEYTVTDEELAQETAAALLELEALKIKSISMRQCRLVLLAHDMLDTVDAAVKQMPRAAQIEWEFASTVDRNNPLTLGLVQLLGLTAEQMDTMFIEANGL